MPFWTIIHPAPETTLYVTADKGTIRAISFREDVIVKSWERSDDDPLLREARTQLTAYFEGRLREFDLPLELHGTPFQVRVWEALRTIPYGQTITYRELAALSQSPKGFRAVGAANGKNPIPIIVPCHRVIESGGGLGGFSCGTDYKRRLLDLEAGLRWL